MEFQEAHRASLSLQKIEAQRPRFHVGKLCNSFLSPQFSSQSLRGFCGICRVA